MMQKIRLKHVERIKDKYCIYLDCDKVYYFEKKRKAEDFLRKVSKNLTISLYFANEEYCFVESIYRQYFFIIKDFRKRMLIEDSLELIRNKISIILFRECGVNRNYIAVHGVELLLLEFKSVYKQLKGVAISRSDTAIRYKIDTKCRILDLFLNEYKNFEESICIEETDIKVLRINNLKRVV